MLFNHKGHTKTDINDTKWYTALIIKGKINGVMELPLRTYIMQTAPLMKYRKKWSDQMGLYQNIKTGWCAIWQVTCQWNMEILSHGNFLPLLMEKGQWMELEDVSTSLLEWRPWAEVRKLCFFLLLFLSWAVFDNRNKCFACKDPAQICKIYWFKEKLKYFRRILMKS